jgi:putative glutamine amidotransferase
MTSSKAPIIGITCGTIPAAHEYHPSRVGQNQTYVDAVIRAGAVPALLPNTADRELLRALYEKIDGLLLSGGGDVDPSHYGEAVHEKCGHIDEERDETELTLARWAVEDGKSLLAICRGIQVLNVALGGSLYQDIKDQVPDSLEHTWHPEHPRHHRSHTISVDPGTSLARILGETSLPVNSLHHQALNRLSPHLTVSARAPDNVIEAVEIASRTHSRQPFAIGVQWHPEELAPHDPRQQGLFDALVESCQPQG